MARLCLHLPSSVLGRRDVVACALGALSLPARRRENLDPFFALHPRELAFARDLLRVHTRFWLFRTHQQAACGDFVVVDMSSPDVARRTVYALELKASSVVSTRGGLQLARVEHAIGELTEEGVVGERAPVVVLRGGGEQIAALLVKRGAGNREGRRSS